MTGLFLCVSPSVFIIEQGFHSAGKRGKSGKLLEFCVRPGIFGMIS